MNLTFKVLTGEVIRVINTHNVSEPLFLFWSMHLVHMPLQVPKAYTDKFSFIKDSYRRLNHAMGNYMDDEIGSVVNTIKARGMWDNSLVVFHSGASDDCAGHYEECSAVLFCVPVPLHGCVGVRGRALVGWG